MKNKTICAIACFLWLFCAFLCLDSWAGSLAETQVPTHQDDFPPIEQPKVVDARLSLPMVNPAYQDNSNDDRETRLQKEKIRAAINETAAKKGRVMRGQAQIFSLIDAQQRLAEAMLDFHKGPEKIISILEQQITARRQAEDNHRLRFESGIGLRDDYLRATYFRANAELQLLRAKKKYGLLNPDDRPKHKNVDPVKSAFAKVDPAYQASADDDMETKLLKEKIRAVINEAAEKKRRVDDGQDLGFFLLDSQLRLLGAMLDFHKEQDKIISLLEQQITAHRKIEDHRRLRFENGIGRPDDYLRATYFRANAELQLLRAKKKYGLLNLDDRPKHKNVDPVKSAFAKVDPAYQANADDDVETKLLKEKIRAAIHEVALKQGRVNSGQDQVFFLLDSQLRLLGAMLDFHKEQDKIISLLEQQITARRQAEDNHRLRFENGIGLRDDYLRATYFRANAELQLLRAKTKYKIHDDED